MSVIKQKKRSGLLLLLFSVIISLLLVGFGIQKAVEGANTHAKQQMKAEVTIQPNYQKAFQDGKQQLPELDTAMIDKIKKIPHVKETIVESKMYVNNEYDLYMTEQQKEMFGSVEMGTMGLENDQKEPKQYIYGISDKEQVDVFKKGLAFLAEGEFPYESKAKNPVLLSKKFADVNKLKVGSTYKANGGQKSNKPMEYTVCGIYEYQNPSADTAGEVNMMNMQHPMEEQENKVYSTVEVTDKTMLLDNPSGNVRYDFAKLVIDDVEEIEGVQNYIKENLEGDWEYMDFVSEMDQYEKMTAAINQVANIAKMILVIGGIAGIVILTLLMLLSFKDRVFEFGILLSLGESRINISCQAILEGLIVLVCGFFLAMAISQPIATAASDALLSNQVQKADEQENEVDSNANQTIVMGPNSAEEQEVEQIDEISVKTNAPETLGMTLAISVGILLVATCIPLVLLFRKDPKVILLAKD
ncbi:ABC transporter permease [Candidatus Enterococcus huntleyi]|uniref:ABC transporter permease n=1 Tax=Candidatus Enterococcus huntleyi TaxID=1857217 RepID=UPI001379AAB6|nr:ABC transporter permease [Enterococcus sp. JM4C]